MQMEHTHSSLAVYHDDQEEREGHPICDGMKPEATGVTSY